MVKCIQIVGTMMFGDTEQKKNQFVSRLYTHNHIMAIVIINIKYMYGEQKIIHKQEKQPNNDEHQNSFATYSTQLFWPTSDQVLTQKGVTKSRRRNKDGNKLREDNLGKDN